MFGLSETSAFNDPILITKNVILFSDEQLSDVLRTCGGRYRSLCDDCCEDPRSGESVCQVSVAGLEEERAVAVLGAI